MSRLVKFVHIDLSRPGIPGIQSMDSSMDLFSSYKKSNKLNFYRKEVIDEVMVKEAQDLKNEVTVGMLLALCLFENHLLRLGSRGLDGQLLWAVAEIPVGSF